LYITGSLTTYQYSVTSDCDVSVFPNYDLIWKELGLNPDEARKELISLSIEHIDGTFLPGSTHPLQFFVVPNGTLPSDLYKPGLRSAFDLHDGRWFQKPEKNRVHDIAVEYPELFHRAQDMADKLTQMLDAGDDEAARTLWHQIHKKRQLDQQAGLGDFCEGNIVYKYLLNEGLFDRIRDELGEYIAKTATNVVMVGDVEQDDVYDRTTREPFIYAPEYDTLYFGPYGAHHHELILSAFKLNHNTDEEMQTEEFSKREQVAMTIEDDPGNLGIVLPDLKKIMYWGEPKPQVVQKIAELFPRFQQDVYDWDDDPLYTPKASAWKIAMPPAADYQQWSDDIKQQGPSEGLVNISFVEDCGMRWRYNREHLTTIMNMLPGGNSVIFDVSRRYMQGYGALGYRILPGEAGNLYAFTITLNQMLAPDAAQFSLWHEIQHAFQLVEGRTEPGHASPLQITKDNWDEYALHPTEVDADQMAMNMRKVQDLPVVDVIPVTEGSEKDYFHDLIAQGWTENEALEELSTEDEQITLDEVLKDRGHLLSKSAADLWDDRVSTKVIYDFDKDTITLGTQATQAMMPESKIIGEYDNGIVTLYGVDKQWVSPQYFHKLWAFSYPDKELKDVYYQREEGNIKLRRVRPQQRSR